MIRAILLGALLAVSSGEALATDEERHFVVTYFKGEYAGMEGPMSKRTCFGIAALRPSRGEKTICREGSEPLDESDCRGRQRPVNSRLDNTGITLGNWVCAGDRIVYVPAKP